MGDVVTALGTETTVLMGFVSAAAIAVIPLGFLGWGIKKIMRTVKGVGA